MAPPVSSRSIRRIAAGGIDPLGRYGDKVVRKPVVMAVQGYCLTIGLELLPATVASVDARFARIEVKRGFYAAAGATIRLQQEIGWGSPCVTCQPAMKSSLLRLFA